MQVAPTTSSDAASVIIILLRINPPRTDVLRRSRGPLLPQLHRADSTKVKRLTAFV
jgi:hypothetical protein